MLLLTPLLEALAPCYRLCQEKIGEVSLQFVEVPDLYSSCPEVVEVLL